MARAVGVAVDTLFLDTETYSECNLQTAGAHRYARDPSTEVLLVQWALNDGPITVEDLTLAAGGAPSDTFVSLLNDPSVELVAHNVAFDRGLLAHALGLATPVERWRCTQAQALAHSLPAGLAMLGSALGLPVDKQKDTRGRALISLFCKPRPKAFSGPPRATRDTHPVEWAELLEYAHQDIITLREVAGRLPKWNFTGRELALWHLDQTINDRGFRADAELAEAASAAAARAKATLRAEARAITAGAVESTTQRDVLLSYLLIEHGVTLPDLQKDTLQRRLDDPELPPEVKDLLRNRLEASATSVSKFAALLRSVCDDSRLRGGLQFAGAGRTGRWSGRLFQPQNMKRPALKQDAIDLGIEAIKAGHEALIHSDVMGLLGDVARGCIVAPPGGKLVTADLANIEGRVLAFLAGEEWKLEAFRLFDAGQGPDLYQVAYGRSFGVPPETATGDKRQIGKVQELALGFQGWVGAFVAMATVYRMDLDAMAVAVFAVASPDAASRAKRYATKAVAEGSAYGLSEDVYAACSLVAGQWREAHPATRALWGDLERAFRAAISSEGVVFRAGAFLALRRDGPWLRIRLPSGRYLCYLAPQVDEDNLLSYKGVDTYSRKWARINTFGGKLTENVTQAVARDVLADAMPRVEAAGYPIVLTVHDEIITEVPDEPTVSPAALSAIMSAPISWAPGLPLAAKGFEAKRYRKD